MITPDLSGWAKNDEKPPYTRNRALADGALVDVSKESKRAGFTVPVAVTSLVWSFLTPSDRDRRSGESLHRRLRAVLLALKKSAKRDDVREAVVLFDVDQVDFGERSTWRLQAVISAGERGEPVVTIMFPHEA